METWVRAGDDIIQQAEMINSFDYCSELFVKLDYSKFYLNCLDIIILKGSAKLVIFSKVSNSRYPHTWMSRAA